MREPHSPRHSTQQSTNPGFTKPRGKKQETKQKKKLEHGLWPLDLLLPAAHLRWHALLSSPFETLLGRHSS
jgi:hypothetical protein